MIINGKKRLVEIMKNETIIEPQDHFQGLGIPNSEFMSLEEFLDRSHEETLKKLYALRELSNGLISKMNECVDGVAYTEGYRPTLAIVFYEKFLNVNNIKFEHNIYIDEDDELTLDPGNPRRYKNGDKKALDDYAGYLINSDTLAYLLDESNKGTNLDKIIREKFKEELLLFKEYLDDEIFYPDLRIKDTTGSVDIATHHHNYFAKDQTDILVFPEYFGYVTIQYHNYFKKIKLTYKAENEAINGTCNFGHSDQVDERIYIHKPLLPDRYLAKK